MEKPHIKATNIIKRIQWLTLFQISLLSPAIYNIVFNWSILATLRLSQVPCNTVLHVTWLDHHRLNRFPHQAFVVKYVSWYREGLNERPVKARLNLLVGSKAIWLTGFRWAKVVRERKKPLWRVPLIESKATCPWPIRAYKSDDISYDLTYKEMNSVSSTCLRLPTTEWILLRLSTQMCGGN